VKAYLLVPILVAMTVGGAAAVDQRSGLWTWISLRDDLRVARGRIDRVSREVEQLRGQVTALREDPFAVERAIRQDLELARPGEVVVRFRRRPSRTEDAVRSHREPGDSRQPRAAGARE
jgi:cell division protein FtsB